MTLDSGLLTAILTLTAVIGWIARTGMKLLISRMDRMLTHMEKINGRLGVLEQRMSASEGREEGRL